MGSALFHWGILPSMLALSPASIDHLSVNNCTRSAINPHDTLLEHQAGEPLLSSDWVVSSATEVSHDWKTRSENVTPSIWSFPLPQQSVETGIASPCWVQQPPCNEQSPGCFIHLGEVLKINPMNKELFVSYTQNIKLHIFSLRKPCSPKDTIHYFLLTLYVGEED